MAAMLQFFNDTKTRTLRVPCNKNARSIEKHHLSDEVHLFYSLDIYIMDHADFSPPTQALKSHCTFIKLAYVQV